jgi:hypothetical protein
MTQEKAWWELKPLQLKHYKTASGARKYAQRTPGRWYIATSFDRCFTSEEEKEDLGVWVAVLDTRYEAFRAAGMDVEAMYAVQETVDGHTP